MQKTKTEVLVLDPYLLVELVEEERETESGLIIASSGQERGKTIFLADVIETPTEERVIDEGARILFTGANSHKVEVDGKDYLIIKREQVVAVTADITV